MAVELKGRTVGGEGKTVEVDGGYFGGCAKPANHKENRRDQRLAQNQTGKRQWVVIVRERGGESVPAVFRTESAALSFVKDWVKPGTIVHTDEASSWDAFHARFEMKRINHQLAHSDGEARTVWAEKYFSHLRRAEIGHHHVAGVNSPATRRRLHGARITAACRTARGTSALPGWR